MYTLACTYFNICLSYPLPKCLNGSVTGLPWSAPTLSCKRRRHLRKWKGGWLMVKLPEKPVALSSIWLGFGKYIFSQNYISARLSSKSKKVHLAAGRAQLQHGADQCQKGAGDRQLLCWVQGWHLYLDSDDGSGSPRFPGPPLQNCSGLVPSQLFIFQFTPTFLGQKQ